MLSVYHFHLEVNKNDMLVQYTLSPTTLIYDLSFECISPCVHSWDK